MCSARDDKSVSKTNWMPVLLVWSSQKYARAIFRWSFWQLSQALELRRHKDKKEEVAEPEADPERDQRTVFAYQICLKADERDVYEFFSRAGKVCTCFNIG
ncbi:hypothetical protein CK203_075600 [Vitis vinifera]|uniref:Uncharacterized protein n=1 Tax=Vitis vinifera TaxID=29760 RepID=A0A438DSZ6_VITVI|nr:hypothetical protein CK203_075600 [Vitis vinifera]